MHHAIWTDLEELYQHMQERILVIERELASDLVRTPYIRLLAIPGINVVSAAELAGEMGPITRYANANAITGRCGLYPSRHQSDQTDKDRGPIIRQANRRIRCALMRIADNLVCHCAYYRGLADVDQTRKIDERAIRVKIAKKFSRLAFACVAGDEPMKHPAMRQPDSIMEKLREFHRVHQTPMDQVLADLKTTVGQLPYDTRNREANVVAEVLRQHAARRRGPVAVGELLPAVLARLVGWCQTSNATPRLPVNPEVCDSDASIHSVIPEARGIAAPETPGFPARSCVAFGVGRRLVKTTEESETRGRS